MLSEGQLDGGIEVVSIDEKAGVVKVKNNGISETLDFANNGAKLTSSAPLAAGMLPQPTLNRPGFPAGVPGPGMRTLPQPAINPGTAAPNAGTSSFGSGRTSAIAQPQFQANVTPEVQTILIEAQRMDLQQQGRTEEAALFPVTEMTPAIQDENFIPAPGP